MAESGASKHLYVRGHPVLSMSEFESYAYGLPEDSVPPVTMSLWGLGEPVELDKLLDCLRNDAVTAAGDSDESLEIVRLALERLKALFPNETT